MPCTPSYSSIHARSTLHHAPHHDVMHARPTAASAHFPSSLAGARQDWLVAPFPAVVPTDVFPPLLPTAVEGTTVPPTAKQVQELLSITCQRPLLSFIIVSRSSTLYPTPIPHQFQQTSQQKHKSINNQSIVNMPHAESPTQNMPDMVNGKNPSQFINVCSPFPEADSS